MVPAEYTDDATARMRTHALTPGPRRVDAWEMRGATAPSRPPIDVPSGFTRPEAGMVPRTFPSPLLRPCRGPLLLAALLVACGTGPSSGPTVQRVVISTASTTLVIGDTLRFAARAEDAGGTAVPGAPLIWSTLSSSVATISTSGLLTAVGAGSTSVIARSGTHADTVAVTVAPSGVASVIITVDRQLLKVSDTVRATARGVDATGATVPDRPVTWTSNNGNAAVVTPFGLILGISPANPVLITATIDGKSASIPVSVVLADIASVTIRPDTIILGPGGTGQFQVTVLDEFGFDATDRPVTWSSFVENVGTVDQTGRVNALVFGESTIRATVGGVTGQALLRVVDASSETFRIALTNYLIYPVEVLLNGNSIGTVDAQSTGSFDRPLTASAAVTAALVRPLGRGEEMVESWPAVADPTGTISYEIDNVLPDGSTYFSPVIRNLLGSSAKVFVDPLPKIEATPCLCSVSPTDPDTRNVGYWLLNGASALRFFDVTDLTLTTPLKTVPVPAGQVEARSGIFRYNLSSLP